MVGVRLRHWGLNVTSVQHLDGVLIPRLLGGRSGFRALEMGNLAEQLRLG